MVVETTIKKGYRKTEAGIIPSDWAIKKLCDVTDIVTGSTPSTNDRANYGEEYLFVSPVDLGKNKYIFSTEKKLSIKGYNLSRKFPKDSILFTCIGSTIGKSGIAIKSLTSNQQINAIFPNGNYYTDYLYYALAARANQIKYLAGEQAVPLINKTQFGETLIPFPKVDEQIVIGTVLSDADALITSLETLIEKKRNIKKGTMQELLTGKRRLPGFSGKWEVKKLGDFLCYEQPTAYLVKDTEYNNNNKTPVLTAGKTFILGYTDEEYGIFDNLPVIIFDDFTTANKFVTFPFKAKSSAMKVLKPKNGTVNLRFIYEMMQMIVFSLSDHKRYWISEYQYLEIKIPSQEEQSAIAEILSNMDTEIMQLEKELAKYRLVKQGMMQELLTGKTRLI